MSIHGGIAQKLEAIRSWNLPFGIKTGMHLESLKQS